MDAGRAMKQWAILVVGLFLVVLASKGRLGSGLGALIIPTNMTENQGQPNTALLQ